MALGGAGALLLAQHLALRHLGEDAPLASMTGVGPFRVCRAAQGLWFLAQLGPALIKSAVPQLGSLPSQPDAHGGAGRRLPPISCHYLTHRKLLFMNSGRRQSRGSHCLMTSDIRKVQSSFCAGRTRAAWHGEPAAAASCCTMAGAKRTSQWGSGGTETPEEVGEAP